MQKLSPKQKLDLETHVKQTRDITTRNRLCAILAYDRGQTIQQIASTLCLSEATVSLYINQYHTKGKTENEPKGGTEGKLSDEQSNVLERHLTETTYLYAKQICAYVEKTFGKVFSRSGMNFWLKERGFTYKKPKKVPGKIDLAKQEAFVQFYQALKTNLKPSEAIYFADAVHPEHQSQAVSGWIKKGEEKTIQTTGKQLRLHFAGAIDLSEMNIIAQEYTTIDSDAMTDFLIHLRRSSKASNIHLIVDNGRAHKNRQVEAAAARLGITIHYLPAYSPNLNPIERLWKVLRETKLYNRYYPSWSEFRESVQSFFTEDIPKMRDKLKSRINDTFERMELNPIVPAKSFV